jgi:hypothetical protein
LYLRGSNPRARAILFWLYAVIRSDVHAVEVPIHYCRRPASSTGEIDPHLTISFSLSSFDHYATGGTPISKADWQGKRSQVCLEQY